MKTNLLWLVAVGLLLGGVAGAQVPLPTSTHHPLQMQQTVTPIFPHSLTNLGVREGYARVVLGVDATGKLDELLVIGYTHPEFADAAVTAIKHWKFIPARLHGEPIACTTELWVRYETEGVIVVSHIGFEQVQARLFELLPRSFAYRPHTLRELDRIPTPITVVQPTYTRDMAAKGIQGTVRVDFYIDETGTVRLPAAVSEENFNLAGLAIPALSQWKFEPPTCQGKPVLVKASQVFSFTPDKSIDAKP
ncbi:MAG: hypothetical protein A3G75_08735 [Verrucomicrobia bacterium RIFCSPLOWO2_12_FULL_64_8]|nr:MAG: hypothetical protein A3G75_08735 [Verrucomicrobia bacterium RIFCSPLOWO2_12_FULL_64_8]